MKGDLTLDDIAWIRSCIRDDDPLGNLRMSRAHARALLDLAEEALRTREAVCRELEPWPGDDGDRNPTCCEAAVARTAGPDALEAAIARAESAVPTFRDARTMDDLRDALAPDDDATP